MGGFEGSQAGRVAVAAIVHGLAVACVHIWEKSRRGWDGRLDDVHIYYFGRSRRVNLKQPFPFHIDLAHFAAK